MAPPQSSGEGGSSSSPKREDLSDVPWLDDEGDELDITAAAGAHQRELLPHLRKR